MAQPLSSALPKPTSILTSTHSPLCTLLFVTLLFTLGLFTLHHHHHHRPIPTQTSQNALRFRHLFLSSATNYTLSSYLRALTLHPHLAGTPPAAQTAAYVQSHFQTLGLDTHTNVYNALLSYPARSSLSAHFSNGTAADILLAESGASGKNVVRPYHAYSPSGAAYGRAVFVNYGREEDYRALAARGIRVAGCVAVARRGAALSRNSVVEGAAEKGMAAVLLYTEVAEGFGDGVERGTVMRGLGDPLSPGWAGAEGGERLGLEDSDVVRRFPKIPSMPISADAAEGILRSLEGARVPYEWRDTLKAKVGRVGPGPTMLNFTYQGENKMAKIQNVFAVIRGLEEPDRFVLLGNHRDAWTYGAVDPNSGTAALLDIARRYALLLRLGWTSRRTIVLCSWDAEEFGMIGSTEWAEQNLVNLGSKAVAYLNVDCAVQGPGFYAGATPQLDDLLVEVTKKVKDPDSEGMTLYMTWKTTNKGVNIQRLAGVDSDFAPFVQHAGVPSIDLYYGRDFPVYHTAFDSYNWMAKYGDPLFQRHLLESGDLLHLQLADDPILPLNYLSYAAQLQEYTNVLSNLFEGSASLHPLTVSIQEFAAAANEAHKEAKVGTSNELSLVSKLGRPYAGSSVHIRWNACLARAVVSPPSCRDLRALRSSAPELGAAANKERLLSAPMPFDRDAKQLIISHQPRRKGTEGSTAYSLTQRLTRIDMRRAIACQRDGTSWHVKPRAGLEHKRKRCCSHGGHHQLTGRRVEASHAAVGPPRVSIFDFLYSLYKLTTSHSKTRKTVSPHAEVDWVVPVSCAQLLFIDCRGFESNKNARGFKAGSGSNTWFMAPLVTLKANWFSSQEIADAISLSRRMNREEGQASIQHEIWRVSRAIQRAAHALKDYAPSTFVQCPEPPSIIHQQRPQHARVDVVWNGVVRIALGY
ncbi:peptidase M28 family protein [Actinidia rufa]|uniref:glutamate carboxypeptidase II n=1 Tax=Actinidia rufa TaxID=165716 RepID=A0A7J0GEP7_9ERIC|nr:peptidase M28 family protein [Actinidia rufa]